MAVATAISIPRLENLSSCQFFSMRDASFFSCFSLVGCLQIPRP